MGIVAKIVQLPASEHCQVIVAVHYNNHWKVLTSMSVSLCTKESLDSSETAYFDVLRILMIGLHLYDSLVLVMTLQHS